MGAELLGPTGLLVIAGLIVLLILVLIISIPVAIVGYLVSNAQRTTIANIVPLLAEAMRNQAQQKSDTKGKSEVDFESEGWDN